MWQYKSTEELYHAGVKGMKWGHRKARPVSMGRTGSSKTANQDDAARAARKKKIKRSVGIGAGVAGTMLAAYGTYKISKVVKNKKRAAETARRLLEDRNIFDSMSRQFGEAQANAGIKYQRASYGGHGFIIDRAKGIYKNW